jgi:hypothetical protein
MKYLYVFILFRTITSNTIKNNKIYKNCKYFNFNEIDLITYHTTFNYASRMRDTDKIINI